MGKLQPKKICNGGGCERKHEVVSQSEKEQNFQGAENTILKRSFLEKTKRKSFPWRWTEEGQEEREREGTGREKKKKIAIHKASMKEVTGQSYRGLTTPPRAGTRVVFSVCWPLPHQTGTLKTAVIRLR